ncbi:hypothetical protein [Vibrio alginolyticus]|uniref:hypothetical protein n=1 Tax=Vibrio alginolyticus TaxID=663 RepID=UPI0006CA83F9|nr:hypothetical protein [Vibrio alginolyticus]KPM97619.1 hypothetical protein AOG25_14240 [Vibrio alginolyticus]CAH7372477.1 conserved hypothetical protein [Vibrio chagasii]
MNNPAYASFTAIIQIGILNSAAITSLKEEQTDHEFTPLVNHNHRVVFQDIECSSFDEWIDAIFHEGCTLKEEGTYKVIGRAKFDEDSSDYFGLRISKVG